MAFCGQCGAKCGLDDRFCAACGSTIGVASAAMPTSGHAPQNPRLTALATAWSPTADDPNAHLPNFARLAQAAALLGFLLPWATVSCSGQELAKVSGFNMATGTLSFRNPMTGLMQSHSSSPEWIILIALLLIAGGLVLSFIWVRARAARANVAGSALALALIGYDMLIATPRETQAMAEKNRGLTGEAVPSQNLLPGGLSPNDGSGDLTGGIEKMIQVETAFGFWFTCAALVIALLVYARMQNSGPPQSVPHAPRTGTPVVADDER